MGAFYSSICLPGDQRDEAQAAIDRWLRSRGFVPVDRPPLFDLDASFERAAFVLTLDDYTVVLFSDFDEERRLLHEMSDLPVPLVYLWVYDSTAWGYDLFVEGSYAGSFTSDPREYLSFSEDTLGSHERPVALPATVAATLGVAGSESEIASLMTRRAVFKEEVARAFADSIGANGALASYDELEADTYASASLCEVRQLLYERSDRARGRPVADLHGQRITHRHPTGGALETGIFEVPADVLREITRNRRRMRLRLALLRPVSLVARGWRRVLEQFARGLPAKKLGRVEASYRIEGHELVNDRHSCRMTLMNDAAPGATSRKPSAVFGFVIDGVTVACNARRLDTLREVVRRPDRAEVVTDERYHVDRRPARWLRFQLPPGFQAGSQGPSILGLHIVEAKQALYVFLYRVPAAGRPRIESSIRQMVESFRLAPE